MNGSTLKLYPSNSRVDPQKQLWEKLQVGGRVSHMQAENQHGRLSRCDTEAMREFLVEMSPQHEQERLLFLSELNKVIMEVVNRLNISRVVFFTLSVGEGRKVGRGEEF